MKTLLIFTLLITVQFAFAQIGINTDNPKASLDIVGKIRISEDNMPPAKGMMKYDTVTNKFMGYDGNQWISLTTSALLTDNDEDTNIEVEQFPDEDIIRYSVNGSERWRMIGARLEPVNTGGSVFIGRQAGFYNSLLNSYNIAIGDSTLTRNTIGSGNVAIGTAALYNSRELISSTKASNNTAIGHQTLFTNRGGAFNTALGYGADVGAEDLENATAIGANTIVDQSNSLILGNNANVGIGTSTPHSSSQLEMSSTSKGLLIPRMYTGHMENIVDPEEGLLVYVYNEKQFYVFDGDSWQIVSKSALGLSDTDNDTKIEVEESIDEDVIRFRTRGKERWTMNENRLEPKNSGGSVFIGEGAGMNDDLSSNRNIAFGYNALFSNTSSNQNTAIGTETLYHNTTGFRNIASGYQALYKNTEGNWNTAYGYQALWSNIGGDLNNANGYHALYNNTNGSWNTATGREALFYNTTGDSNTAIGYRAGVGYGDLENATAIGANAIVDQSNSLVLGDNVNVGIGTSTPAAKLQVIGNVDATAFSGDPISFHVGGTERWVMKERRLEPKASGGSIFIGENAGYDDSQYSTHSIGIGTNALYNSLSGKENVAVGNYALYKNSSGEKNIAIGENALFSSTNGLYNVGIGTDALYYSFGGIGNSALGHNALTFGGTNNTAIGYNSQVISGYSNSTAIGANATVGMSNAVVLGNNVNVGIGTSSPGFKLHVIGSGSFQNLLQVGGQLNVSGNICYTGSIGACSDIRYKKDFESFTQTLDKLKTIKGQYYYWNQEDFPEKDFSDERQIGVMAQEVETAFPELVMTDKEGYKSVDYSRLTPILLEAIKEQQILIENQESRIKKLELENNQIIENLEVHLKKQNLKIKSFEERLEAIEKPHNQKLNN
ncbi:tail fiber domain-containing protein [Portibacter lacus]|uniref:Peptidase S74 domain-containing protein n=1 Tax=Portibacter lacus TaxID=1099794 RepID=A0AA37SU05_9BACT|nr:tail fiber domain-containing protein [Portibacter lacus]GLR20177.1 hypothetical protein GCM10007940_47930 [Portibacter lacus]